MATTTGVRGRFREVIDVPMPRTAPKGLPV
jgi:hypothetical protein